MLNFVNQVIVPVRKSAAEGAEQVTQLLLGDVVEVLEEDRNWRLVRNLTDGYEGWVDRKLMIEVEATFLTQIAHWEYVQEVSVLAPCSFQGITSVQPLTIGCRVPIFKGQEEGQDLAIRIGGWQLEVKRAWLTRTLPYSVQNLLMVSEKYMGAPYLWGGKTRWGIDCSGFTQMVFGSCGILLPRDAYQQAVAKGADVPFGKHLPGDLAFFQNDKGRITHVGIVIEDGKIRHSSGFVHDAWLRPQGIFSPFTQLQTHNLANIRRFA